VDGAVVAGSESIRDTTIPDSFMATNLEVRWAAGEDAAAIGAILYGSFLEFRSLYTEGGFAATVLDGEGVLNRMDEGPIWIAEREGVILGTVAAVVKGSSVYIRGMAVLPSARGSGAGAALLRQAEEWAVGAGFRHVFLSTTPFLTAAIRLYEKSGFRRKDNDPQDLFGTPLFVMEKTIPD
jgi:GNAT superfamily N-acetyltransferase